MTTVKPWQPGYISRPLPTILGRYSLVSNWDALIFRQIDISLSDQLIDNLSEDYIAYLSSFNYVFDSTYDVLDYLNAKYELHIITNGFEEVQFKKLKNSGILHYFSTVTTSEGLGLKKPNPLMFMAALDKANASAKHSIMIGDSFEADILGAKNIGMETIFYNYRNEKIPDEFKIINALSEIKSYL